jgi:hypothetical protein
MSYGLQDNASTSFGNTATWIANWIAGRAGSALLSTVRDGVTGTDEVLKAHDAGMSVVRSRSMESVAAVAAEYAVKTVSRKLADLRHFFAAFVESPSAVIVDIAGIGWMPTTTDIGGLQRELYHRIAKNPEAGEDLAAWAVILRVDETPREENQERASSPTPAPLEISGFTSDRVEIFAADRDPLELLSDVKAFARLICLEEAEPPISIGLFGGWGSGKSTFMQLLESEIDKLTSKVRSAAEAESKIPAKSKVVVAPTFIRNVVQVRFNAWHFADANLWASLTAEFFDQLRAGGYARSGKAIHTRLVERVNAHVHALTSEAVNARQTLLTSEAALRTAQKERDQAVAEVEKASGQGLQQTIVNAVTKSFEVHKADLLEMGRRTYHDNPVKDIEDFIDLAKRLQTASGQLGALIKFVFARGWRASLAVGGITAVLASLWFLWRDDLASRAFELNALNIFAFLAGLGAFSRAVLPGVRIIGRLIESTSGFAVNLDSRLESEIKKVAQAEETLQRAAAETEARRAAAERAGKALARYVDPNSAVANPPRLLRFMLEDDPDTRALEKEIGVISRVRRLFQAVDEIVRQEKEKDDKAKTDDQRRDPDVPDRIVIYIDDLDRCTPTQVYAVLQAVHLLLAFKLFVVVVGVDVNWVQDVLARELRAAPNVPTSAVSRAETEIDERKLAIRYLEKIFQLPFWLRRLSSEGEGGGSYGRFVRALLSQNLTEPSQPPVDTRSVGESGQRSESDRHSSDDPAGAGAVGGAGSTPSSGKMDGENSLDSGLDEALATVQLTKDEVNFLASKAIGNLSGREPRTVKRFANIYRIIRARLTSAERSLFLGDTDTPPDYPLVSVLIAVETGQSLEVAEAFYAKLSSLTGNEPLGDDLDANLSAAFKEAQQIRKGAVITQSKCFYWARMVRRYSFNKYI